jgi:hypothetical protein
METIAQRVFKELHPYAEADFNNYTYSEINNVSVNKSNLKAITYMRNNPL